MGAALYELECFLSGQMDDLKKWFKGTVKVAVLIRTPGNNEADVMFGDLEPDEAIALVERRKAAL